MRPFLLALSLSLLLLVVRSWSVSAEHGRDEVRKAVFILAGQSNMAGRGGVTTNNITGIPTWDGVVPPECQPNRSVLRLSADLNWVEAREPLHADIDVNKTNGIGPGMAFANTLLAKDPKIGPIGLVPCAIGGTKISEWERGQFLYDQLTRRAQAALRNGGTLRAILWYQGEKDCEDRADAELYHERLKRFFDDLVADLQSPGLPIFQVALASGEEPYRNQVREAQLRLGAELPNVRTIDANGLPLEPDGLHLTAHAQVQLGQMLADAFFRSIPNPVAISEAPAKASNFAFHMILRSILFLSVMTV